MPLTATSDAVPTGPFIAVIFDAGPDDLAPADREVLAGLVRSRLDVMGSIAVAETAVGSTDGRVRVTARYAVGTDPTAVQQRRNVLEAQLSGASGLAFQVPSGAIVTATDVFSSIDERTVAPTQAVNTTTPTTTTPTSTFLPVETVNVLLPCINDEFRCFLSGECVRGA